MRTLDSKPCPQALDSGAEREPENLHFSQVPESCCCSSLWSKSSSEVWPEEVCQISHGLLEKPLLTAAAEDHQGFPGGHT